MPFSCNTKTQIHIVVLYWKSRIETLNLSEQGTGNQQTGSRDGAAVTRHMGKSMISPFLVGDVPERMTCYTSHPKNDTCMLDPSIGIQKFGSHRTNPGSRSLFQTIPATDYFIRGPQNP